MAKKTTTTKAAPKAKTTKGTKAKPRFIEGAAEAVLVDVTQEVLGAIEAKAETKSKRPRLGQRLADAKAKRAAAAPVEAAPVEAAPAVEAETAAAEEAVGFPSSEDAAAEAMGLTGPATDPADDLPTEEAEAKAADAVYQYGEKLGIAIDDVCRIAKTCGEYDLLVSLAGMEITERIVWLAKRKASDKDAQWAKYRPRTGLSTGTGLSATGGEAKRTRAPAVNDDGTPRAPKARCSVFGHAATAAIRALRATCGLTFAQIRNVLDALGAEAVADATIRAQMAGGGTGRGEPAPLTAEQIAKAKELSVAAV